MLQDNKYEVNGFEYNGGPLPKYLQAGLYKVSIIYTKDGEETSGIDALIRLS